jgi:2C-methyl-D-erythritol 2,4-cyclodiphosphate synthase
MKKVLLVLMTGLLLGALAASHAKLPAAPPMSDADKAAKAEKDAAAKAKETADLGKAQDKAVANYKKNKGVSMDVKKKK